MASSSECPLTLMSLHAPCTPIRPHLPTVVRGVHTQVMVTESGMSRHVLGVLYAHVLL